MIVELGNPTIVSELSTTVSIVSGSNNNHAPNDDSKGTQNLLQTQTQTPR